MKFGLPIKKWWTYIAVFITAFCIGYVLDTALDHILKNGQEDNATLSQPAVFQSNSANELSGKLVVHGLNGATCTSGSEYTIVITGGHKTPDKQLYRVTCGDFDSQWCSENMVTINGLKKPGPYTATVKLSDNLKEPDKGTIEETAYTFFKL